MAKVIVDEQQVIVEPWWERARIVFIGAGIGLLWWGLAALLNRYIIEPLACRDLSASATACVDSFGVAGNVTLVIVTLLGVAILVRWLFARPLIIGVASAIVLWGLGTYLTGLGWFESLLWSIGLFAATYTLFFLVTRLKTLGWSLVLAAVIVLAIRLLLVLY